MCVSASYAFANPSSRMWGDFLGNKDKISHCDVQYRKYIKQG